MDVGFVETIARKIRPSRALRQAIQVVAVAMLAAILASGSAIAQRAALDPTPATQNTLITGDPGGGSGNGGG